MKSGCSYIWTAWHQCIATTTIKLKKKRKRKRKEKKNIIGRLDAVWYSIQQYVVKKRERRTSKWGPATCGQKVAFVGEPVNQPAGRDRWNYINYSGRPEVYNL